LLSELTAETIDTMVEVFVGSPLLHAEARHLGGAAAVSSPDHGALHAIDAGFMMFSFGLTLDEAAHAAVEEHVELLLEKLKPWDSGRRYLNFAESRVDPRSIFPVESYDRMCAVKTKYDPTGIFQANHPVAA
jgi:FAD/FMN-containing dehydrogenase